MKNKYNIIAKNYTTKTTIKKGFKSYIKALFYSFSIFKLWGKNEKYFVKISSEKKTSIFRSYAPIKK